MRAGRSRWPCRTPPRRTRRWAAWPPAAPPPPMAVGARPRLFLNFFLLFFKTFKIFFFCVCLFFCIFFLPCFGLAPFLPFLKKILLFRFSPIAFGFFLKFSSHALVLIFLSFFCSCCLVSLLLFFEERSSCDSNPQ